MIAISLSEEEFKWLRKKDKGEKWAAIRIYSQWDEVRYFSRKFEEQFENTLITQFTDIDKEIEDDGKIYKPFGSQNYDEIIDFVKENRDCEKLYIHCHAGICRSAGVVVGLANKFDWIESQHGLTNQTDVYPYPNVVSWFME